MSAPSDVLLDPASPALPSGGPTIPEVSGVAGLPGGPVRRTNRATRTLGVFALFLVTLALLLFWRMWPQGPEAPGTGRALNVPRSLAGWAAVTVGGVTMPLVPQGVREDQVLLVVSTTCVHCAHLMGELGIATRLDAPDGAGAAGMSGLLTPAGPGRLPSVRYPNLTVLAIQGAGPLVAHAPSVTTLARALGPAEPDTVFARHIGLVGTPMLLQVAPDGTVRQVEFGLRPGSLDHWRRLMGPTTLR